MPPVKLAKLFFLGVIQGHLSHQFVPGRPTWSSDLSRWTALSRWTETVWMDLFPQGKGVCTSSPVGLRSFEP